MSQANPTSNPMAAEFRRGAQVIRFRDVDSWVAAQFDRAADEIERLTRELETSRSIARGTAAHHQDACLTCDRLRAALKSIRDLRCSAFRTDRQDTENMRAIASRALALPSESNSAPETSGTAWQPIETAPKDGRTLLLGYFNSHGKWRSLHGQWFQEGSMDEWDGPDYTNPAGWYETSVENDDPPNCWATEPTHWHPTLRPPEKADGTP